MIDLNARTFYKSCFSIDWTENEKCDPLWDIILKIRSWLIKKYNKDDEKVIDDNLRKWTLFKNSGVFYDLREKNDIYAISCSHRSRESGLFSWACRIEEHQISKGYAPRTWVTEIGYQQRSNFMADISYIVSYYDGAGFIGDSEPIPSINVPSVVRWILKDEKYTSKINEDEIFTVPQKLYVGDWPRFEKIIFNPNRKMPIIFAAPCSEIIKDECPQCLINPYKLLESVMGNANVYYSQDADFLIEMSYMCYKGYTCFDGNIRLYMGDIDINDENDRFRHRYVDKRQIEEWKEDKTLGIFRKALSQDFHYNESFFRYEDCDELIKSERRDQLFETRIEEIRAKKDGDIDEVYSMAESYLAELKAKERDLEHVSEELKKVKAQNNRYQNQIESVNQRGLLLDDIQYSLANCRSIETLSSTREDIIAYFEKVYMDRVVFTERAKKH